MSASWPSDRQHLDAAAGRKVVYCHACSYEWYRDEQGLECPRCHSEITEVVDPSEDPRDLSRPVPNPDDSLSSASTSPEHHHASVTIFSGPSTHPSHELQHDPFQDFFNSTMRDMGPPPLAHGQPSNAQGPPMGFAQSLQEILNLFNPANAAVGDAVYSQEALDRIITNLMEQNLQSNAAPPASEQALQNLERKEFTKELLGEDDKAECAICIDSFEEGQTVTFLPCKHWFHDECVVLWLKKHNTCPVCRTPIETREQRNANQGGNRSGNGSVGTGSASPSDGQAGPDPSRNLPGHFASHANTDSPHGFMAGSFASYPAWHHGPEARVMFYRFGTVSRPTRPTSLSRPPRTPLNQVMRDISTSQREQHRTRDREAAGEQAHDISRFQQRRTPLPPSAPRAYTAAELGARMRQRSPSSSERHRTPPDRGNSGPNSSSGPFGWLRDRLGGSQREGRGS